MRLLILRAGLMLCVSMVGLGAAAADAVAQNGAMRSSRAGVYTKVQAARGSDTFAGRCTSCHTPESHATPAFRSGWSGFSLWDLFVYLTDQMPKTDPGTLSPREYAQVLAYILELNGMPPGETELPPDSAVLGAIRFDTVATRQGGGAVRR